MTIEALTQAELKTVLGYNPDNGIFTWKISGRGIIKGKSVGSKRYRYKNSIRDKPKCIHIKLKQKVYMAHHLACLYMTGDYPKGVIDHIDGNPFNNEWSNIRDVSITENNKNRVFKQKEEGGVTGVRFDKASNKWKVSISNLSKYIHLGYFENLDDAISARRKAEVKYGYHENHGLVS